MPGREQIHAAARGEVLRRERSQVLRLFALGFAIVAALAIAVGAMLSAAQAAPQGLGALKQFRVPTDNSQPRHITVGSDGNLWFTEGNEIFTPDPDDPDGGGSFHRSVGRITPTGEISEFPIQSGADDGVDPGECFCLLNDIVQGPNGILYFTTNEPGLGRITTSGEVLSFVKPDSFSANGGGIAAHGNDIWYTDFNNDSLWRYEVSSGGSSGQFTQFEVPTPNADPLDVAVAPDGTVWFTGSGAIRSLDPQSDGGVFTETPVTGSSPRHIAISSDGKVWFTDRFNHRVGYLDPSNNNQVTQFDTLTPNAGPVDIVAAPDGNMWFTQTLTGNVARITPQGVITEGKRVNNSEPFGITMGPDGQSVWYTMMSANKIARLTPR
jgi:virginiamycin B lyase